MAARGRALTGRSTWARRCSKALRARAELAIRTDYVNGADTSPVAFLEGIYVVPEARRSGIARELVAAAERWALSMGCTELACDARIENTSSHAMHAALGFVETERVVFFKKVLR